MKTLVDQYVAAAGDDFPGSGNAAIAKEVRAAIEDVVEARRAEGMSQEDAEWAAAEELGDPRVFAEQFRQEPRYLVGPKVFRAWWSAMRIALAAVIPLFIALGAIEFATGDDGDAYDLIGLVIGGAFEGLIQVAFWVTLTFAIIELTGHSADVHDESEPEWTPADLPKISSDRQIGIGEVIASVVALVAAMYLAVRLQADQLGAMGINTLYDLPASTRVFNPELSERWAVAFFALMGLSLVVSIWSFVRGSWTRSVLAINLVENGLWLAFFALLANAGNIINPAILESSSERGEWDISGDNSNSIIVGIGLFIVAWDIFEAVKGHLDYRNKITRSIR